MTFPLLRKNLPFLFMIVVVLMIAFFVYGRTGRPHSLSTNTNPPPFSLDVSVGGSIFGGEFQIHIVDDTVVYTEREHFGGPVTKTIRRILSQQDRADLLDTIQSERILALESQDFRQQPTLPDQAQYQVSLSMNNTKHDIVCAVPLDAAHVTSPCSKPLGVLIGTLNRLLGVRVR